MKENSLLFRAREFPVPNLGQIWTRDYPFETTFTIAKPLVSEKPDGMSTELSNLLLVIVGFLGLLAPALRGVVRRCQQMKRSSLILFVVGILGAVSLVIGVYRITSPPRVTEENIETKVREWLDAFALGTKKLTEPTAFFAFQVDLPSGVPLAILRIREHSHYLTMVGQIKVVPRHLEVFQKLSEIEKKRFLRELRLEAAKSKIAVQFGEGEPLVDNLSITKRIPITDALTEATLMEGVGEMNYAMIVVLDTIALRLEAIANK